MVRNPEDKIITEKLRILGFNWPDWPSDTEEDNNWITTSLNYLNGIRFRRAQLRNLSVSKKNIFHDLFTSIIEDNNLSKWEHLAFAFLKPEVFQTPEYQRWQICTKLIRSSDLTKSQLLGASLELASQGMISASIYGIQRILKEWELNQEDRLSLFSYLIENINLEIKYRQSRGKSNYVSPLSFLITINRKLLKILLNIKTNKDIYEELNQLIIYVDQEKNAQHGHVVFINKCKEKFDDLKNNEGFLESLIIEVGCSREIIEGQNSTNQLIKLSKEYSLQFLGIDIDKEVINPLKRDYKDSSHYCKWIVGKGEEILKNIEQPIAAIYLDGYDFEHNMHSEFRQKVYVEEYGKKINDNTCHKSHLECAQTISKKMFNGGLIGLDDTWRENNCWKGKGTDAILWLLKNDWQIIDESNRACILSKKI